MLEGEGWLKGGWFVLEKLVVGGGRIWAGDGVVGVWRICARMRERIYAGRGYVGFTEIYICRLWCGACGAPQSPTKYLHCIT